MRTSFATKTTAAVFPLVIAGWLGMDAGPAAGQEEHRVEGDRVAVYNLAGTAEIVRGSGSSVTVRVMRGGRDAERLEVEVFDVRGRNALVVRYPADEVVYPEMGRGSRTTVRVRSDGTFSGGSGGERVRISGRGSGFEAWADLLIEVPGGKDFALFLAAGEVEAEGVEGSLDIGTGTGRVTAQRIRGSLDIDTGSGAVNVWGVEGDLTVDTGSGRVEFSDVNGDEVDIDTGSGSVTGSEITARSVNVDTGSGGIDLAGVTARDIYLDTGSGSVDVDLLEDVASLEVDTGSGGVTVRMPSSLGARIEVETGSGGIDADLPLEIREVRRHYLRGVIGDGDGRIVIDTGSGRVRLIPR